MGYWIAQGRKRGFNEALDDSVFREEGKNKMLSYAFPGLTDEGVIRLAVFHPYSSAPPEGSERSPEVDVADTLVPVTQLFLVQGKKNTECQKTRKGTMSSL
jgi:hypothetical protein